MIKQRAFTDRKLRVANEVLIRIFLAYRGTAGKTKGSDKKAFDASDKTREKTF